MVNKRIAIVAAALLVAGAGAAALGYGGMGLVFRASDDRAAAPAPKVSDDTLTVVELFTSQACATCPAAEAFLANLSDRHENILALEFHITYWDDFVDGARGRWQDPFADPAFTDRQRKYNRRLRGTPSVYTPQMVVDGFVQANGVAEDEVLTAIDMSAKRTPADIDLNVGWSAEGGLTAVVDGRTPRDIDTLGLWLITYDAAARTLVKGGENMGRVLDNHNIVREMIYLGQWSGGTVVLEIGEVLLTPNQRCALLVQAPDQGPVSAAARCPAAPT